MTNQELEFSVVIPLTDDRGQGVACIKAWVEEQSYDRAKFEVIVLINGASPTLEDQVKALLKPQDVLLHHSTTNEFFLYDLGARHARGKLLFFSEAHCVPEADCLEQIAHYFATHPADGARCRSIGANTTENFLTQMEEQLFEEAFHQALQPDHWLKVLVHGFGIYRDVYLEEGGIEYEFGQFAEWALAARLHSRGRRLGYAAESVMHHYYMGDLTELFLFVRDFTHGECGYRARYPTDYCEHYFGRAPEWSMRASYRAVTARRLCRAILKNLPACLTQHSIFMTYAQLKSLFRWAMITFLGPAWPLWQTKVALKVAKLKIWLWRFNARKCYQAYRDYWATIIQYCRLEFIAAYLPASTPPAWSESYHYDLTQIDEERLAGFYPLESWRGQSFRWSEPAALLHVSLPPGDYRAILQIPKIKPGRLSIALELFFDNQKVGGCSIDPDSGCVSFQIDSTMFEPEVTVHRLILLCRPLYLKRFGSAERRALGLPIRAIHFYPRAES